MRKVFSKAKNLFFQHQKSFSEMSKFKNNFLSTTNVAYIESMYENWIKEKNSVSPSLNAFFELL